MAHSKIVCAFLFIFAYGHDNTRIMKSKGERLEWALTSKAAIGNTDIRPIKIKFRKISKEELEANRRSCYQYLIP